MLRLLFIALLAFLPTSSALACRWVFTLENYSSFDFSTSPDAISTEWTTYELLSSRGFEDLVRSEVGGLSTVRQLSQHVITGKDDRLRRSLIDDFGTSSHEGRFISLRGDRSLNVLARLLFDRLGLFLFFKPNFGGRIVVDEANHRIEADEAYLNKFIQGYGPSRSQVASNFLEQQVLDLINANRVHLRLRPKTSHQNLFWQDVEDSSLFEPETNIGKIISSNYAQDPSSTITTVIGPIRARNVGRVSQAVDWAGPALIADANPDLRTEMERASAEFLGQARVVRLDVREGEAKFRKLEDREVASSIFVMVDREMIALPVKVTKEHHPFTNLNFESELNRFLKGKSPDALVRVVFVTASHNQELIGPARLMEVRHFLKRWRKQDGSQLREIPETQVRTYVHSVYLPKGGGEAVSFHRPLNYLNPHNADSFILHDPKG